MTERLKQQGRARAEDLRRPGAETEHQMRGSTLVRQSLQPHTTSWARAEHLKKPTKLGHWDEGLRVPLGRKEAKSNRKGLL